MLLLFSSICFTLQILSGLKKEDSDSLQLGINSLSIDIAVTITLLKLHTRILNFLFWLLSQCLSGELFGCGLTDLHFLSGKQRLIREASCIQQGALFEKNALINGVRCVLK